jgi:hypothetical protein
MRRVKRAAVSIKPKQPYMDWANSLDSDGVKIGVDYLPEGRIYLVDDLTEGVLEVPAIVEPYYEQIWEEELGAWHRREKDWPKGRDFTAFQAWFEIEVHSLVLDLKGRWLWTERYERY